MSEAVEYFSPAKSSGAGVRVDEIEWKLRIEHQGATSQYKEQRLFAKNMCRIALERTLVSERASGGSCHLHLVHNATKAKVKTGVRSIIPKRWTKNCCPKHVLLANRSRHI